MKYLVILSFFWTSMIFSYDIEIELEFIEQNTSFPSTSTAYGDKLIEYNNHKLLDVISWITEIPLQYVQLKGETKNPSVNFRAVSEKKITSDILKKEFIETLNNKFNIQLSIFENERFVKIAYNVDQKKLNNKICRDSIISEKTVSINRTWKGSCVSTTKLIDQIEKWYNEKIVNDLNQVNKYDLEIHKANSFEELVQELTSYYGIKIKEDKRQIEMLLIDFK